jgi:hypothetical protein
LRAELVKPKRHVPHYKAAWIRVVAVAAVISAFSKGEVQWGAAGGEFRRMVEEMQAVFPEQPVIIQESNRRFMERWWDAFKTTGKTKDLPRSGRPRLIPPFQAIKAASIIKKGRVITPQQGRHTEPHTAYYTSISEAIMENEELSRLVSSLHCNAYQLLSAMHQFVPGLVRKRVMFKRGLTPAEMEHRVRSSKELLRMYNTDDNFLQKLVFIDETTIFTHGDQKDHVYVWVDEDDKAFDDVCHVPLTSLKAPNKAHVIAAVTANDAFNAKGGLVYMDFTTGTSSINRRHNKRLDGSQKDGAFKYTVSMLHCLK